MTWAKHIIKQKRFAPKNRSMPLATILMSEIVVSYYPGIFN
jgi:hypothetical protein